MPNKNIKSGESIDLVKKQNETDNDYIIRICSNKEAIGTWYDVRDFLNSQLSKQYTESRYRKLYQNSIHRHSTESIIVDLEKEKVKLQDERRYYKSLIRERARQEELNDLIYETVHNANADGSLPYLEDKKCTNHVDLNETMFISLCDLHIGAFVHNGFNDYDTNIAKKYFQEYTNRIIVEQCNFGCESCVVWNNGDTINGAIHKNVQLENKENVAEQITIASELISEFLHILSGYFKKVFYVCVSGNHTRLDKKDEALKNERLDDVIYYFVKSRCSDCHSILFGSEHRIDETMYFLQIGDYKFIGVHGDYDGTDNKLLSIMSTTKEDVYAVLCGHKHSNIISKIKGTNVKLIQAGSFLGTNDYCIQHRLFSQPEQLIFIVDSIQGITNYIPVEFNRYEHSKER